MPINEEWKSNGETALLLIDLQNAFLHQDGENYYSEAREVIAPCLELVDAARAGNRLIIYVVDQHRDGLNDFEQLKLPVHGLDSNMNSALIPEFEKQASRQEIVLPKRRYSAFFGTDLQLILREQKVDRLVIAGVKTNVCVRATTQDAFGNGFKCLIPREATNSNRTHLAKASLEDIDRYMGWVVSLDDAVEVLI